MTGEDEVNASEMLVDEGYLWLGDGKFLDVASWRDGTVTIAVASANGERGEEVRFDAGTPQAFVAIAAMTATKKGA